MAQDKVTIQYVVTALSIHSNQVKSDHPYYDHHMVERHA